MLIQTTLRAALAVITLSILAPQAIVCAQNPSALAQSPSDELARLQGTWQGTEVGREGEGNCKLIIKGNAVRFEGAKKNEWYVGTMTLPASKNPKQLSAHITECPHPDVVGKVATAIYKLEGGTLTLVGHAPGDTEPPKGFEGDESSRTFILKKSEPEKQKSVPAPAANLKLKGVPAVYATVEQRFDEVDIALAIAQYEKLQTAAFELRLKRELESQAAPRQLEEWSRQEAMLRDRAANLREETVKRRAAFYR